MAYIKKIISFLRARFAPRGARISFSQAGEDLIIINLLKKIGIKKPFYIDIGAHDPIFGNNTYLLYRLGGRGILVEPNPEFFNKIRKKRKRDICLNIGVGKTDGEADFFTFSQSTRNTFSPDQAKQWQKASGQVIRVQKLKVLTLDSVLNLYCRNIIPDIFSIDAEGLDMDILSNYSWEKRPKIICVELADGIIQLMRSYEYRLEAQVFQNAIFFDEKL